MKLSAEKEALILAIIAIVLGAFTVVASLGYIEFTGRLPGRGVPKFPAPPWVGTCAGSAFLFSGVSLMLKRFQLNFAASIAGALGGLGMGIVLMWSAITWS